MKSVRVRDPQGRRWRVSVRMIPWRLQWRGPGTRRKDTPFENDRPVRRRWYDFLEFGDALSLLDEGLGAFVFALLIVISLVAAILFVIPVFIFLVEVLIVALLVVGVILVRILFRQPWLVDAVADDGTRSTWNVKGYRHSRRVVDELASLIAKGVKEPSVRGATAARGESSTP